MKNSTAYDQFSRTARQAAKTVIANYSTSFALATRFLGPSHRDHIRNIYALVRIADEIVDGLAADAGLTPEDQERLLESFVDATKTGLKRGISDNLIIHAFAQTAQAAGITAELIDPFFDSMRTDLESAHQDLESPSPVPRVLAQRPFSPTRQNQPRPPVPPGPPTPRDPPPTPPPTHPPPRGHPPPHHT
ncbi:MAG: phytoene/squalene synthase family protein, partial [Brevibacterium sp.]